MADHNSIWSMFTWGKIKAFFTSVTGKETAKAAALGFAAENDSLFNMFMFGSFGAVSALANQIEYLDERHEIAHFYREELAAKHQKEAGHVNDRDLSDAEKTNGVIRQAVNKERNFRNIGIVASFVASVAVFALMGLVAHDIHMAFSLAFAAKVAVGGMCYLAIKSPLSKAGAALLGIDKDNTHDLIEHLARDREHGKAITREQVVEVFISGNKQLTQHIEQSFGRPYAQLELAEKVRVSAELATKLPIDKITHNINLGTTKASELAYTVEGDISGVLPKRPERRHDHSAFAQLSERCKQMMHSLGGMFHAEKAHSVAAVEVAHTMPKKLEPAPESPVEEFNNGPSFVERLGRAPAAADKGYVDKLAERAQQQNVVIPGTTTLQ